MSNLNLNLGKLTQKEVTRKEFLGISALAVGSVLGFGGVIRLLTGKSVTDPKASGGYGVSPYGK
jgi:hypothetical protein